MALHRASHQPPEGVNDVCVKCGEKPMPLTGGVFGAIRFGWLTGCAVEDTEPSNLPAVVFCIDCGCNYLGGCREHGGKAILPP